MFLVLVFVHELGHFLAAKYHNIKVEEFSLGFPPRIFSHYKNETRYSLGVIPLGGFVKLQGHNFTEENPTDTQDFSAKTIAQRFWVLFWGPLANIFLTYFLFVVILYIGVPQPTYQNGEVIVSSHSSLPPDSLQPYDRIISLDEIPINNWREFYENYGNENTTIQVERDGQHKRIFLDEETKNTLLINPFIPPIIGEVVKNSAAERAQLHNGDRIVSFNSNAINEWHDIIDFLQQNTNKTLLATILRSNERLELLIEPEFDSSLQKWRIGIALPESRQSYSILDSFKKSAFQIYDLSTRVITFLGELLIGKASTSDLGGPVMIAKIAGDAAQKGLLQLLYLTAFISLQLAIINLLPIPVLDGGHIVLLIIEKIKGGRLSVQFRKKYMTIGTVFLMFLMVFLTLQDIIRFL